MKSTPILFSAPMVRAIRDGRKTQTRRIIRPQPTGVPELEVDNFGDQVFAYDEDGSYPCPYGQPSDQLWVREEHFQYGHWEPVEGVLTNKTRWQKFKFVADSDEVRYADNPPAAFQKGINRPRFNTRFWYKRLARFMPRRFSRITLEVTGVRVERLQDISEADAIAEGVTIHMDAEITAATVPGIKGPAYLEYFDLWQTINGPGSWDANPWVWVVEFKRVVADGESAELEEGE